MRVSPEKPPAVEDTSLKTGDDDWMKFNITTGFLFFHRVAASKREHLSPLGLRIEE
jgi:hypothetical protein